MESLRVLGALFVFLSHIPWLLYLPDGAKSLPLALQVAAVPFLGIGGMGVTLFLVVSGAVLCRTLAGGMPAGYLRARLGRLFPRFWFIAVPVLVLGVLVGMVTIERWYDPVMWLLGLGFLTKRTFFPAVPSWWYMALAWQVVVLAPALVWALRRVGPVAMAVTATTVSWGTWLALSRMGASYAERAVGASRIAEIAVGALAALLVWPEVAERLGWSRRAAAAGLAVAICGLAAIGLLGFGTRWLYRAGAATLAVAILATRPLERREGTVRANAAVAAGGVTFAFYLVHEPCIGVISGLAARVGGVALPILILAALATSSVAAVLLSRLFEKASAAVRHREARRAGERSVEVCSP